jgi:rfaE bifunctional protein kinase chain/domain
MQQIQLLYRKEELKDIVDRFPDARVLVVGDIIMDEYIWGDVSRISPEAPVPVVEVKRETKMLGGAANVIHNMAKLGAKPHFCGVVGEDGTGLQILEILRDMGLSTDGVVVEPERPTSVKTRVVAQNQQVVRFDRESREEIRPESRKRLLHFIRQRLASLDIIAVSDYGKGVVSGAFMDGLRAIAHGDAGGSVLIGVDPKICNFRHYHDVDVLTPNHHEAGAFCGVEIMDDATLVRSGRQMIHELNCRHLLITQGKDGMTLFERDGEISHIPTVARKVFDVTGAGDTVIATLCLGLAAGLDPKSAAIISNYAAGIVVGEVGTSTVSREDLKRAIDGLAR